MTPAAGHRGRRPGLTAFWASLLVAGLLLPWAAAQAPEAVDRLYSRGLFRYTAEALGAIGSLTRVSLAQLVIGLALLLAIVGVFLALRRMRRRRSLRAGLGTPRGWLASLAVLVWLFHLSWGLHYARPPLRDRLGLAAVGPSPENLARLVRFLAAETNRSYDNALDQDEIAAGHDGETPSGTRFLQPRSELLEGLDRAYRSITPSMRDVRFSRPKFPEPSGYILTRLGISGFYFPFTGEATVDAELPEVLVPFTAAHEMAHQRGTAREDEANMLAYLACRRSGSWSSRYSGALGAYRRAAVALWRAAPDSFRADLLRPGPRADLDVIRRFWQRHEGAATSVATRMNDSYLKANRQREGVASYGRMVELLLAFEEAGLLGTEPDR